MLTLITEQNELELDLSFWLPLSLLLPCPFSGRGNYPPVAALPPPLSPITLIYFVWPSLFWKTNSAARQPEDKIAVVDVILISDCNCSGAATRPDVHSLHLSPTNRSFQKVGWGEVLV